MNNISKFWFKKSRSFFYHKYQRERDIRTCAKLQSTSDKKKQARISMSMATSFLIVSETASQFIEIQQTPSSGDESNVDNTYISQESTCLRWLGTWRIYTVYYQECLLLWIKKTHCVISFLCKPGLYACACISCPLKFVQLGFLWYVNWCHWSACEYLSISIKCRKFLQ